MRIGQFEVRDPVSVCVEHIRDSDYADYFSASWAPPAPPITPAHLWRANHLAAGWQIREVREFMELAAADVDRLLRDRPAETPGTPDRREWFDEVVAVTQAVDGVGAVRLCKALHPIVPRQVPLLDNKALRWAITEWFPGHPWGGQSWTDVFSLLDGIWAEQEAELEAAVRQVSEQAPGRLASPFGVIDSVVYAEWSEARGRPL